MNKLTTTAILILCVASLTACGKQSNNSGSSNDTTQPASTSSENMSTVNTPEATISSTESASGKSDSTQSSKSADSNSSNEASSNAVSTQKDDEIINLGTTSKGYTIQQINGITYVDGILIANKTYPLPSSYNPGKLDSSVQSAFKVMQNAAAAEGLNIYISSGFRSYSSQKYIYNNYVNISGQAEADRYSARAGHSEHQTGLAFDLNSIDDSFAATPEGVWVAAHAHEYGFIIRYPQSKEGITGYMYESWHLRYLGNELAQSVYNSGLCLEEYLGINSSYTN